MRLRRLDLSLRGLYVLGLLATAACGEVRHLIVMPESATATALAATDRAEQTAGAGMLLTVQSEMTHPRPTVTPTSTPTSTPTWEEAMCRTQSEIDEAATLAPTALSFVMTLAAADPVSGATAEVVLTQVAAKPVCQVTPQPVAP